VTDGLRRAGGAVIWLAVIVAIALGAAGIVTGMDHPPTATAPSGVPGIVTQFSRDPEVSARLDAVEADLTVLTDKVDALGQQARASLAALNGTDTAASEAAIAAGDSLVAEIVARSTAIRSELATVPYIGTPTAGLDVSAAVLARHAALADALDATDGLDADWARLSAGSVAATKMSGYLAEHDRLIAEAAKQGRLAKYDAAIVLIDKASAQLDAATAERDELKKTVDVSVLDEWIARNRAYDAALKNLYKEIKKVGHRVTSATRKAVKAEADARSRLPPDTRALVIIMADIGRSGMNGAVIDIEEARAKLSDAVDASGPDPSDSPPPTDAPTPTPSS
jgi:cell division septum initiation protein DivIVA